MSGGRYDQVSRMYFILELLSQHEGGLTINQIFEKVSQFYKNDIRTVRRDIEGLEASGFQFKEIPDAEDSRTKRIVLDRTVRFGKAVVMSPQEILALYLARGMMTCFDGTPLKADIESAFKKLDMELSNKALNYLKEITGNWSVAENHASQVDQEVFSTVNSSIDEGQMLSVMYDSVNTNTKKVRKIGPHFMHYAKGAFYLIGEEIETGMVKSFHLSRMSDAEMLNEEYSGVKSDPLVYFKNSYGVFNGKGVEEIVLHVRGPYEKIMNEKRFHNSQTCAPHPEGGSIVKFNLQLTPDFVGFILGLGPSCEVLQPETLRAQITETALAMLSKYPKKKAA